MKGEEKVKKYMAVFLSAYYAIYSRITFNKLGVNVKLSSGVRIKENTLYCTEYCTVSKCEAKVKFHASTWTQIFIYLSNNAYIYKNGFLASNLYVAINKCFLVNYGYSVTQLYSQNKMPAHTNPNLNSVEN